MVRVARTREKSLVVLCVVVHIGLVEIIGKPTAIRLDKMQTCNFFFLSEQMTTYPMVDFGVKILETVVLLDWTSAELLGEGEVRERAPSRVALEPMGLISCSTY